MLQVEAQGLEAEIIPLHLRPGAFDDCFPSMHGAALVCFLWQHGSQYVPGWSDGQWTLFDVEIVSFLWGTFCTYLVLGLWRSVLHIAVGVMP